MNNQTKFHYNLFTCTLGLHDKENITDSCTLNVMAMLSNKEIRLRDVARIQSQAINLFHERYPESGMQVFDVVVTNISYLGHMTEDEFKEGHEPLATVV